MQKEIKVNKDGSVEVAISVSPSTGTVTEVRSHNVSQILRSEGIKHGHPMPNNPVVSSDLSTKGVHLSGVFKFEAPQVVTPQLASALGLDPSMDGVVVKDKPAPKKPAAKKPAPKRSSSRKKAPAKSKAPASSEG